MTQSPAHRTSSDEQTGTFEALLAIVERLRDPDGCPWDRAQTHASLRQYLLEECYEAIEAIDSRDTSALAEELGDLLVHIAFHADIAKRSSEWTAGELVSRTAEKLVRRHPHVFSDAPKLDTAAAVVGQWETLKRAERGPRRITESVPRALPALAQAAALQRKAEAAGIEWRGGEGLGRDDGNNGRDGGGHDAVDQARLEALRNASEGEDREAVAGDLLFDIAAEIRSAGVDPETALRSASGFWM
jgi:tetrapyrrole methylase family protein/MazG family protein